jgi:HSP20 family protein
MINFLKHRTKNADTAPEPNKPAAAPQPVPVEPTAPAGATATPEPVIDAIPDSIFWSGTSIADELIRVEERWQDDGLVVRADLPGVDPDRDIHLTVLDRHLVIEAERRHNDTRDVDGYVIEEASCALFTRALTIRDGVDASAITATYNDGVLEVRVPMPKGVSAEPGMRIPVTR